MSGIEIPNASRNMDDLDPLANLTAEQALALFWDEDGDWDNAQATGLLQVKAGEESTGAMERTELGERIAALIVEHAVASLTEAERVLLREIDRKGDALNESGRPVRPHLDPDNELVVLALMKREILYDRDYKPMHYSDWLILTHFGREICAALEKQRKDACAAIDKWLDETGAHCLWSRDLLDGATIEGYRVNEQLVVVFRCGDGRWKIFTQCHPDRREGLATSDCIDEILGDAGVRCGFSWAQIQQIEDRLHSKDGDR